RREKRARESRAPGTGQNRKARGAHHGIRRGAQEISGPARERSRPQRPRPDRGGLEKDQPAQAGNRSAVSRIRRLSAPVELSACSAASNKKNQPRCDRDMRKERPGPPKHSTDFASASPALEGRSAGTGARS